MKLVTSVAQMCGALKTLREMTSQTTTTVNGMINQIKIRPVHSLIQSKAFKTELSCIETPCSFF
jgi:hypothetical protein